jgi:fructose-specific phosphotransferase system IIC component
MILDIFIIPFISTLIIGSILLVHSIFETIGEKK